MDIGFWQARWQEGQIGFHEGSPNELLVRHAARLGEKTRVLVPLAGKAVDLAWLAGRGHEVVGIEVVPEAVHAFFADRGVTPKIERRGHHEAFSAGGVTLVLADMFDVGPDAIGTFDAIYDRAALVALLPDRRKPYVEACARLLAPGGITLLVAFAYDQTKASGPPFSADEASLRALFAPRTMERLETHESEVSPRMRAAGVPHFDESIYAIG